MEQDQSEVHEWFKVFFDPDEYNSSLEARRYLDRLPSSHAEVKRYYHDFLSKLYQEIKKALRDNVREWSSADIEFLFSVPTTWTKLSLTQEFQRIAKSAGFGREGLRHHVEVSLTESEAAAVYTFKSQKAMYSVSARVHYSLLALIKVALEWRHNPHSRCWWRYNGTISNCTSIFLNG